MHPKIWKLSLIILAFIYFIKVFYAYKFSFSKMHIIILKFLPLFSCFKKFYLNFLLPTSKSWPYFDNKFIFNAYYID